MRMLNKIKKILIYRGKTDSFDDAEFVGATRANDYTILEPEDEGWTYWAYFETSKGQRSKVRKFVEFE